MGRIRTMGDLLGSEDGMDASDMAPKPKSWPVVSVPGRRPFGVENTGASNGDLVSVELAHELIRKGWASAESPMGETLVVGPDGSWFKVDPRNLEQYEAEVRAMVEIATLDKIAADALEAERSWECRRMDELEAMTRTPVNAHLYGRASWDPKWFRMEARDEGAGEDNGRGAGAAGPEAGAERQVQGSDKGRRKGARPGRRGRDPRGADGPRRGRGDNARRGAKGDA